VDSLVGRLVGWLFGLVHRLDLWVGLVPKYFVSKDK